MSSIIYRSWHDGSHYVATKYYKKAFGIKPSEGVMSLKNYESEYLKENRNKFSKVRVSKSKKDKFNEMFDNAYIRSLELPKKERAFFIHNYLLDNFKWFIKEEDIEKMLKKKYVNLANRIDRFRKKAMLNKWNYFVTITYDDEKHTEETFKKGLKKLLSNLHSRWNWLYMGVFERSKNGRLHFHALMFIPEGAMRGKIEEIKDYSFSDKKIRSAFVNTYFLKRFGRNDFTEINSDEMMNNNTINYLIKYLEKSQERIVYSRGIATYLYIEASDDDVVCKFGKMIVKYVLFDNIIENAVLHHMRN